MNIPLILIVTLSLIADFAKVTKDKKVVFIYLSLVIITLFVAVADKYQFFARSPLEKGIEIMKPITGWIETKFK